MDTTPTPIRPELASADHIERLNEARRTLGHLVEAARQASWELQRGQRPGGMLAADSFDYGRFAAKCDTADDAIFDALNTMNAYRIQSLNREQLIGADEGVV